VGRSNRGRRRRARLRARERQGVKKMMKGSRTRMSRLQTCILYRCVRLFSAAQRRTVAIRPRRRGGPEILENGWRERRGCGATTSGRLDRRPKVRESFLCPSARTPRRRRTASCTPRLGPDYRAACPGAAWAGIGAGRAPNGAKEKRSRASSKKKRLRSPSLSRLRPARPAVRLALPSH